MVAFFEFPFPQSAMHENWEWRVAFSAFRRARVAVLIAALAIVGMACDRKSDGNAANVGDPNLQTNGTLEVSAKLVEIPEGAIFKRDLYDYATILKYQVVKV